MEPEVKAYDFSELGKRLAAKGLIVAEVAAEEVYKETKQWLKDSALKSETKYDDLVVGFIDQLDSVLVPIIDKIDGKEG